MRLHFTFEFEAGLGSTKPMSDYIQDEQRRLADESAREAQKERSRLHNTNIIQAKAPDFWNATILSLKRDCEQCAATFPNDGKRNPQLTTKENGFELRNVGIPANIFQVELRVEANFVKVIKRVQRDRYGSEDDAGQEDIRIEVDSSDEIRFVTAANQFFDTPNGIARYFIELVCGFRKTV